MVNHALSFKINLVTVLNMIFIETIQQVQNKQGFFLQKNEGGAKTLSVSWYVLSVSREGLNRFLNRTEQVQDCTYINIDISPQCDLNCRPVPNIDFRWRRRLSEGGGVDVLLLSLRGGGGGGGGGLLLFTNHLQYLVLSLYREQMKRNPVKE